MPAPTPPTPPPPPVGPARPSAAPRRSGGSGLPHWMSDQSGAPAGYQQAAQTAANPLPLANAGGGLILGALTYALGLTYLRSGGAGVKALLAAKFLNKTSGSSKTSTSAQTSAATTTTRTTTSRTVNA